LGLAATVDLLLGAWWSIGDTHRYDGSRPLTWVYPTRTLPPLVVSVTW
jgi:hypothetical protein